MQFQRCWQTTVGSTNVKTIAVNTSEKRQQMIFVDCIILFSKEHEVYLFLIFENSLNCLWFGFLIFYILLSFSEILWMEGINRVHISIQHITVVTWRPKKYQREPKNSKCRIIFLNSYLALQVKKWKGIRISWVC